MMQCMPRLLSCASCWDNRWPKHSLSITHILQPAVFRQGHSTPSQSSTKCISCPICVLASSAVSAGNQIEFPLSYTPHNSQSFDCGTVIFTVIEEMHRLGFSIKTLFFVLPGLGVLYAALSTKYTYFNLLERPRDQEQLAEEGLDGKVQHQDAAPAKQSYTVEQPVTKESLYGMVGRRLHWGVDIMEVWSKIRAIEWMMILGRERYVRVNMRCRVSLFGRRSPQWNSAWFPRGCLLQCSDASWEEPPTDWCLDCVLRVVLAKRSFVHQAWRFAALRCLVSKSSNTNCARNACFLHWFSSAIQLAFWSDFVATTWWIHLVTNR